MDGYGDVFFVGENGHFAIGVVVNVVGVFSVVVLPTGAKPP